MIPITMRTADPQTQTQLRVAPGFLQAVNRASELLSEELGDVTDMFHVRAVWQFLGRSGDAEFVALELTADPDVKVGRSVYNPYTFRDDEKTLIALRPMISMLARSLSGVVKNEHAALRKQLDEDVRSFAAISEE